jgi:hypothetical protein
MRTQLDRDAVFLISNFPNLLALEKNGVILSKSIPKDLILFESILSLSQYVRFKVWLSNIKS